MRVEEVEVRSVGGAVRLREVEGSVVFGSDGFVVLGRRFGRGKTCGTRRFLGALILTVSDIRVAEDGGWRW